MNEAIIAVAAAQPNSWYKPPPQWPPDGYPAHSTLPRGDDSPDLYQDRLDAMESFDWEALHAGCSSPTISSSQRQVLASHAQAILNAVNTLVPPASPTTAPPLPPLPPSQSPDLPLLGPAREDPVWPGVEPQQWSPSAQEEPQGDADQHITGSTAIAMPPPKATDSDLVNLVIAELGLKSNSPHALDLITSMRDTGIHTIRDLAFGWDETELSDLQEPVCRLAQVHGQAVRVMEHRIRYSITADSTPSVAVLQPKWESVGFHAGVHNPNPAEAAFGNTLPSPPQDTSKATALASALVNLFAQAGPRSTLYQAYHKLPTAALRTAWMNLMKDELADFDWRGLQAALATWSRWATWCASVNSDMWDICPTRTALFLRHLRDKGPTASRGAWGKLRFLELHIGIPFGCTERLTKAQARTSGHQVVTSDTLMPRDIYFLLAWAKSKHEPTAFFASAVLVQVFGCLRWRHMQRSKLISFHDTHIVAEASSGKTRKHGSKAPPFKWVVPLPPAFAKAGTAFWHSWHKILTQDATFLVPKFIGPSLAEATGFHRSPISEQQFNTTLNALLAQSPWPDWPPRPQAAPVGARHVRRLAPTIAHLIDLPYAERFALGSWQDNATVITNDRASTAMPMPALYTSDKLAFQCVAKSRCATFAVAAAMAAVAGSDPTVPGSDPNATWQQIMQKAPRRPLIPQPPAAPEAPAACTPQHRGPGSSVAMPEPRVPRTPNTPSSSSSSSDSSSSGDSSSEESAASKASKRRRLDTHPSSPSPSREAEPRSIHWVLPQGAAARLHRAKEPGAAATQCGVQTSAPLAATGTGLQKARAAAPGRLWCRRCALDLFMREDRERSPRGGAPTVR